MLTVSGCGSTKRSAQQDIAPAGTLKALLARPGRDVAIVAGTSDYSPGPIRFSFLVIRNDGRSVMRPQARLWVSTGLSERPFTETTASLERVGVPGGYADALDVTHLYMAHFAVPKSGKYWVLAEPVGGQPIQALGNLIVKAKTDAPALGSKAFPSRNPTIASAGGDLAKLTTRVPPDRALLRYSVAESLAAHKPFVLVFATPKFCTSRTCGPVVDVVDRVRQQFARTGIRFIHVEIYENNNPSLGVNRWVHEWKLPTEPFVFLVGRDGRIKAKFEGSVSVAELAAAVRAKLA